MDDDDSALRCEMTICQDARDKPAFELQAIIAAWERHVFVLQPQRSRRGSIGIRFTSMIRTAMEIETAE